ncbi:hypothetical protein IU433_22245 [Nocardia puris]|nr:MULTISPECIES: hypothetical protein [Nocardia]MBF6216267.1 hypothetical protein [Nocardia puris]MBF6461737.1 hypothetical protein [Nocardia puris]
MSVRESSPVPSVVVPGAWLALLMLSRQVRELIVARDDLLDAAAIHALCEHEERLIGQARYYDRTRACAGLR